MKTDIFKDLVSSSFHFKMKIIKLVVLPVVVSSSCKHSAAAKPELPPAQKRPLGHRYTSSHPENCFYPQPSSSQNCSIPDMTQRASTSHFQASMNTCRLESPEGNSSKAKAPVDWERPWPSRVEAGSVSFKENQGTMAETASGGSSEAQEDSTFSAYDNLHSLSLCQSKEDVSGEYVEALEPAAPAGTPEEVEKLKEGGCKIDSSSSWSSCEILPFDEGDDSMGAACLALSPRRRQRLHANKEGSHNDEECEKKSHNDDNEENDEDEDEHVYYPASPASCSVSPLSTGSSDVFLPAGSPEHQVSESPTQPSNTHSLLAELRQQMASQRAEYQARIQR